jgi:hypothetical protein
MGSVYELVIVNAWPVMAICETVTGASVSLVIVMVADEVWPTVTLPKANGLGVTFSTSELLEFKVTELPQPVRPLTLNTATMASSRSRIAVFPSQAGRPQTLF